MPNANIYLTHNAHLKDQQLQQLLFVPIIIVFIHHPCLLIPDTVSFATGTVARYCVGTLQLSQLHKRTTKYQCVGFAYILLFMVALSSRADHYIFALLFLSVYLLLSIDKIFFLA